jgi:hypothetical protein
MANPVTIKTASSVIDGTPDKRVFWSIISDYGLVTGLCELVDNALDLWILGGKKSHLSIKINLDKDRQLVSVEDNAGGVTAADLRLLIAPGGSRNSPHSPIIGVFGVGANAPVSQLVSMLKSRLVINPGIRLSWISRKIGSNPLTGTSNPIAFPTSRRIRLV